MSEDDQRWQVEIEPAKRLGGFLRDKPCLRVTLRQREQLDGGTVFYTYAASERTRTRDPDEARALAARLISEREQFHSKLIL